MTIQATVTDPICGMTVDPAEAAGSSTYDGETFYFCSRACKSIFDANQNAASPSCCTTGHSCC